MINTIWSRQDEINRQSSVCSGNMSRQTVREKINSMTDEEFMCTYNPYYIVPEDKKDKVWCKYRECVTEKYSLHPMLVKRGMTESRRNLSACGIEGTMILFCTRIEHQGDSMFRFYLEDLYGQMVSEPIFYNHRYVPDTVGRLLKVECTFTDNNVMITRINTVMPYDDERCIEGAKNRIIMM